MGDCFIRHCGRIFIIIDRIAAAYRCVSTLTTLLVTRLLAISDDDKELTTIEVTGRDNNQVNDRVLRVLLT